MYSRSSAASRSASSILNLTTSPIEMMPIKAPFSVTGMWRMRRRVMRSITSAMGVSRSQVTTPRVMHSAIGSANVVLGENAGNGVVGPGDHHGANIVGVELGHGIGQRTGIGQGVNLRALGLKDGVNTHCSVLLFEPVWTAAAPGARGA